MAYLFSLALGPAQEFIAAARRTRDLWFSSWLLSELSKAAAKEIGKDRLIFPSVDDDGALAPDSVFNVVNKILAKVDDDPQRLGESVKAAVHRRLNEIRDEAFRGLLAGSCNLDKAKTQIDDLPEIYWAAVPLNGDYTKARRRVEALLAARKNTRDFQSSKGWAGNEYKSSLDGLRESIILDATRLETVGIKPTEKLCGIGLLKRLGERTGQAAFASTSHIAAFPLIDSLQRENRRWIEEYFRILRDDLKIHQSAWHKPAHPSSDIFEYDGHLIFEEQLDEYFDKKTQREQLGQARKALDELLRKKIGAQPVPYYAVLHGDGDRMGEVIDNQGEESHKKLSAALSQFAGQVKSTVKQHHGSLIYAGGDDVLALVPLQTVVQCACELAEEFKNRLSEFKSEKDHSPTLSVGIGISHQMEPLEDALNLAREAEKEAKQFDNKAKDALCVKVSKRSGTVTTVVGHWGALDERLKAFTVFHQQDEVPDDAAYELRRLAEDFNGIAAEHKAEAYRKEAARILSRKRAKRSTEEVKKDVQEKLMNRLSDDPQQAAAAIRSLADELVVAKLFVNKFEKKERPNENVDY